MSKKIILWIWFGIFIRVLMMPFAGHPDLFINFANTFHLIDSGVVDGYKYLAEYYGDKQAMFFLYDPLHYFLFGLWSGLTGWITGPEYQVWMREVIDSMFLNHSEKIFSFSGSEIKLKTLFIWKSLYLFFDLLALFCILKILPGEKEKESFAALWAGSVVFLYSLYLFGQSGIVPTALIVLGLYLFYLKVPLKWVGLCFALSVPFKLFSLLLLPLPFLLARGRKERIETALFSLLPLGLIYVPLAVHSEGLVFWRIYGGYAAYATEGLTWNWILVAAKLFLGAGYLAVCYHAWSKSRGEPKDLARYIFIVLLLLLSVPLKIYYYIWVIPFWLLFINEKRAYRPIYYAIIFLLFFSNLSTKQTFIGVLAPLDHDFFMAFPGWMDIGYFILPSGIHVKLSVLVIFLLTLAVVCDQLLGLFEKEPLFKGGQAEERTTIRSGYYVFGYPAVLFALLGALVLVSHPSIKPYFHNFMFANSNTPYTWNFLTNFELPPGKSMTQRVSLLKGRIKDIRYRVKDSLAGPIGIEILSDSTEPRILYKKDFDGLEKGWGKFEMEANFVKNKTAHFRITNLSSKSITIPVYRIPRRLKNFQLTVGEGESGAEPLSRGVLPLIVTEEPEFLYKKETAFGSIWNNLYQEKGFILLWLALAIFCYAQSCRYLRRS